MKLKKVIMAQGFSALVEVVEKKLILVLSIKKVAFMVMPPLLKGFGLTNVDSVGVSVKDLVNPRRLGIPLIDEFHDSISLSHRTCFG